MWFMQIGSNHDRGIARHEAITPRNISPGLSEYSSAARRRFLDRAALCAQRLNREQRRRIPIALDNSPPQLETLATDNNSSTAEDSFARHSLRREWPPVITPRDTAYQVYRLTHQSSVLLCSAHPKRTA